MCQKTFFDGTEKLNIKKKFLYHCAYMVESEHVLFNEILSYCHLNFD